jgi:hypothetical protein
MSSKIIVAIVAVLAVAAGAGWWYLQNRMVETQVYETVVAERDELEDLSENLAKKLALLEQALQKLDEPVDEEKIEQVFSTGDNETRELSAAEKAESFFRYLDDKGYLQRRDIPGTAAVFFERTRARLLESRPVIIGEIRDMFTLLKNITYFYGVLGRKEVLMIRDILEGEPDIIEPAMAYLFEWISPWSEEKEDRSQVVPPDVMYEYSTFFLQTIAGQTYLFRRDSRLRHLVRYYCVLVLDRANQDELNSYGIDIRPHIDSLLADMQSHRLLAGRTGYLTKLAEIREKY